MPRVHILADENVPGPVVERLRRAGHDVAWILQDAAGAGDARVLARMRAERRVLLTFDKGFGDYVRTSRLPKECGVVLIRLRSLSPSLLAQFVAAAIGSREDWTGRFAVIEPGRVRMRPLGRARARRRLEE